MKKIIYLIVVVLTVYLNVMYQWPAGIKVLSAELVFPLICIVFALCTRKKVHANIILKTDIAEQKEKLPIQIEVENTSIFPAAIYVVFAYKYAADGKMHKNNYKLQVGSGKNSVVSSEITAEYCGKLEVGIQKIKVYDCWGFFSVSKKETDTQKMIVMPKPYPVNLTVSNRTRWFPVDGESYANDRAGDDSAEIYEVREYRAGDRMQKVHWKLSAKEDNLYIKEFSYPLGAAVVLLLEGADSGRKIKGNDFIEAVVSVSMALLEKECPHYIIWKEKEGQEMQRILLKNEEDFYAFLLKILEFEKDCLETDMEEKYRYEYRNETYSTLLKISTDLFLQINGQEKMDMRESGIETFFETMELIV